MLYIGNRLIVQVVAMDGEQGVFQLLFIPSDKDNEEIFQRLLEALSEVYQLLRGRPLEFKIVDDLPLTM